MPGNGGTVRVNSGKEQMRPRNFRHVINRLRLRPISDAYDFNQSGNWNAIFRF